MGILQELLSRKGVRQYVIIMELFDGEILNYPTYGKELYTLVKIVKLKQFLLGRETITHIDYRSL